jgi:excisionase family DNA binding protein
MSDYLTAEELALKLRLAPDTVREMARRGKIPAIRISPKVIRFDIAAVDQALRAVDPSTVTNSMEAAPRA